jgi:predicted Ser/Thr protein kinase
MSSLPIQDERPLGVLRDYTLLNELGRGSHGTVYRARSTAGAGEIVALKVIEDNSSLDRLLIEPQLLAKLHHRNIVGLRDYFLHGGTVVLVMEYVDGPDLGTWLTQQGPLTPAEVRDFLVQMAGAIAHAHASGVVHSDLKASNILVDTSGEIPRYVIVDFGVSRIATGIALSKRLAGTYAFMAPEQLRGRGTMQSDLWALGVLAYTLLTGSQPFQGETREEIRRQILFSQPLPPPQFVGNDGGLERIIVHLLEKNAIDRIESSQALLTELTGSALHQVVPDDARVPMLETMPAWEQSLHHEVRRRERRTLLWVIITWLPELVVPGLLSYAAVYLFYLAQVRRRAAFFAAGLAAFALAVVGVLAVGVLEVTIFTLLGAGPDDLEALSALSQFVSLLFGFFMFPAAANFVKARHARRDLTLLKALRTAERERSLILLRYYVTTAPGDTNMRLRYIEALLAAGRVDEAAVEAQLLLELDPYNLGASLLLANAYVDLGLLDRAEQVCNWYLSVSPQCFEFEDLHQTVTERRKAA